MKECTELISIKAIWSFATFRNNMFIKAGVHLKKWKFNLFT